MFRGLAAMVLISFATIAVSNRIGVLRKALKTDN